MKRLIVMVAVTACLVGTMSRAETPTPTPTPAPAVEWVYLEAAPVVTPTPPPPPPVEIREFDHNSADIETLARLLWSSPLREEEPKKTLLWVVLNRVDDQSGLFGDSIADVVTKHEFSFYDRKAHLSDANMELAKDVLDAWMSRRAGCYIGRTVPANGLYIRFTGENNRDIEVTAEPGGDALVW